MRTPLQHRQVHFPSIYPLCTEEEDDWHVLFACDTSCSCWEWEQAGLTHILQQLMQHFSSVIEVMMDICSVEEKSVAGHVAMVMWVVWNNRNNWLWNGQKRFATQLGNKQQLCYYILPTNQRQHQLFLSSLQWIVYPPNLTRDLYLALSSTCVRTLNKIIILFYSADLCHLNELSFQWHRIKLHILLQL
jgi:hypothetical protein